MAAAIPLSALQPDIRDPALPSGSQSALADADGRILVSTETSDFSIEGQNTVAAWVGTAQQGRAALFEGRDLRDADMSTPPRRWRAAISSSCCRRRPRDCCPGRD